MATAGLGDDLLLANEVVDATRLRAMSLAQDDAMITVSVDSEVTVDAAAAAGIANVIVDVNVGLPRCGVGPAAAGRLADYARSKSLRVRGVMGYEGHLMLVADRAERSRRVAAAMDLLLAAHRDVGGEIVSAGGTGTFDLHDRVSEIQAGSYALMDTHYGQLGLPFRQACFLVATVISANDRFAVADVGLKALGMDHGNPTIDGATVWFCSDEHVTFAFDDGPRAAVGNRILVVPAHIDPTMAMHDVAWLVDADTTPEGEVLDRWSIDLRGW